MSWYDFGVLVRKIDNNVAEKDIEIAFNIFDQNQDRKISLREFEGVINLYRN